MDTVISWLALSLAVWFTALLLPGFRVRGAANTLIVAALFGLASWLIGALLLRLLPGAGGASCYAPLVARWIVSSALLKLVSVVTRRLELTDVRTLIVAGLLMSVLGTLTEALLLRLV